MLTEDEKGKILTEDKGNAPCRGSASITLRGEGTHGDQ